LSLSEKKLTRNTLVVIDDEARRGAGFFMAARCIKASAGLGLPISSDQGILGTHNAIPRQMPAM
jgi:hypothetical protein